VKVKPVQGWETTDGRFWHKQDEAIEHQNRLDFLNWCGNNICVGGEWSATMVAQAILDNFDVRKRA
jgi:hypothetical protein